MTINDIASVINAHAPPLFRVAPRPDLDLEVWELAEDGATQVQLHTIIKQNAAPIPTGLAALWQLHASRLLSNLKAQNAAERGEMRRHLSKVLEFIETHDGWVLHPGQDVHGWIVQAFREAGGTTRVHAGVEHGTDEYAGEGMRRFSARAGVIDSGGEAPTVQANHTAFLQVAESPDVAGRIREALCDQLDRMSSKWAGITWMSKKGRAKSVTITGMDRQSNTPWVFIPETALPLPPKLQRRIDSGEMLAFHVGGQVRRGRVTSVLPKTTWQGATWLGLSVEFSVT